MIIGDRMQNKFYKYLAVLFYLLSFFLLIFSIKVKRINGVDLNINFRLVILFLVCMLIYISGFILTKKLNYDKKILKINLIIYFLIYIFLVFSLTLFDDIYNRNGLVLIDWDKELLKRYLDTSFNIVPFKTIKLFINGYINGFVSIKSFCINILGNLFAFMPCALFIPILFKKINKYYKFLIILIISVVIIEILQFITMSGSCDIDDLILNITGATVAYYILKIKFINKIINRIFLFE